MLSNNLKQLYFSQSALGTYQSCQLRFRRRYLEGLYWPNTWALDEMGKAGLEQGRLFHLLAQRYFSGGMDPHYSVINDPVREWLSSLVSFRPFQQHLVFQPEQELRLNSGVFRLVAKFDLLLFTPEGRSVIYDWKTTSAVPKQEYWRKHLQTVVYRYVLCAAGEACSPFGPVKPEDLSMIYWNPQYPGTYATLGYSEREFVRDGEFLQRLMAEIMAKESGEFFATTDQKRCRHCEYSPVCLGERAVEVDVAEDDQDLELDWDSIEQILPY